MTIEISLFKLAAGVRPADFRRAAREATPHLEKLEGFWSRQLFHDSGSDQWADVLLWESRDHAVRASEEVLERAEFEPFIRLIDPSSIQMVHGESVDVSA